MNGGNMTFGPCLGIALRGVRFHAVTVAQSQIQSAIILQTIDN
jgi:hypothetical protein